jgi:hypothetical protein
MELPLWLLFFVHAIVMLGALVSTLKWGMVGMSVLSGALLFSDIAVFKHLVLAAMVGQWGFTMLAHDLLPTFYVMDIYGCSTVPMIGFSIWVLYGGEMKRNHQNIRPLYFVGVILCNVITILFVRPDTSFFPMVFIQSVNTVFFLGMVFGLLSLGATQSYGILYMICATWWMVNLPVFSPVFILVRLIVVVTVIRAWLVLHSSEQGNSLLPLIEKSSTGVTKLKTKKRKTKPTTTMELQFGTRKHQGDSLLSKPSSSSRIMSPFGKEFVLVMGTGSTRTPEPSHTSPTEKTNPSASTTTTTTTTISPLPHVPPETIRAKEKKYAQAMADFL